MRVGTRESKLAMRQTDIFREKLAATHPEVSCTVVGMKSLGDIDLKSPLNEMPKTGAFVRELDDAIRRRDIDASVNSLKDIPIDMDEDLVIAAIFTRDSDEDVILPCRLEDLPEGARVGTASVRRSHMLREVRPDLVIENLRGNIHTRLGRLDDGEFDAIILAKAGLDRMGIDRPMHILDKEHFIPAPAQGAIAVECRADDAATREVVSSLDDPVTRTAVTVERTIMSIMEAGCSSPVGINAEVDGDNIRIRAVSYGYTDEPRRVVTTVPASYSEGDLRRIADYLVGRSDSI